MHSVSIIIPIYNGERYLYQCLESIQMQGYTDFEVLMIDDGSTDGSAGICMEFAERDSRFRYKHKENGGVSSARNVGIEESTGEWLLFVDADDGTRDCQFPGRFLLPRQKGHLCRARQCYSASEQVG